ncbi:MAG: hypothetical protein K1Y36_08870 [Blastocatellia bacterium]|nr:hypothetical protein [Blastocatellia bacterium]
MQRLFSMFPQGWPGLGLLLLRLSVAAILLTNVANRSGETSYHFLLAGGCIVAFALSIGFLIPLMAGITCLAACANLLLGAPPDRFLSSLAILNGIALTLLGPGAYSLDARLFGRRVIVVPPRKSPNHH